MLDSSRAVTQRFHNHFKYTIQTQLQTITARTCIIYLPHSVQKEEKQSYNLSCHQVS